jgi:hypothetical protein
MDPDIVHDPVFHELLLKFELESRKLRDAVIAMRSFYLTHHKAPKDETTSEKWRGALLSEEAAARYQNVEEAAGQLLRYGFEIAPHSSCPLHMEELLKLKSAHRERVQRRAGWGYTEPHPKGIEEQVQIDDGPPITWVIKPTSYEFTERARRATERRKPAIDLGSDTQAPEEPD